MTPYYENSDGQIYHGNVLDVLKELPDESVHMCVTSPPYWGLRDYGNEPVRWEDGLYSLGLEPTPELFIKHMVQIFGEVKRVLRSDATCWINIGDSYAGQHVRYEGKEKKWQHGNSKSRQTEQALGSQSGIKPKNLIGTPWMLAFALRADGWYLRSDIIWHKPNPMPESVTDRPTKAHEYLFLLTKSAKYYYDADAVREKQSDNTHARYSKRVENGEQTPPQAKNGSKELNRPGYDKWREYSPKTFIGNRNKRSVWTIPTEPTPEAHFATFPKKLVEPCILAGTSEKGCCEACGAPWERVVEVSYTKGTRNISETQLKNVAVRAGGQGCDETMGYAERKEKKSKTTGWKPGCKCIDQQHTDIEGEGKRIFHCEVESCTVLDPFLGSGKTAIVAYKHNRKYIGIELSQSYLDNIAIPKLKKQREQRKLF